MFYKTVIKAQSQLSLFHIGTLLYYLVQLFLYISAISHFVSVGVAKSHITCTDSSDWCDLNQYPICLFCMSAVVKQAKWVVLNGFQSDVSS